MRDRKCMTPNVAIAKNDDEAKAIREAVELLDILDYIGKQDVVVIDPNWVNNKGPSKGVVVGPESLREIIRLVKSKSPKRVVVATGTADGETPDVMKQVGYSEILQQENVELVDLNHGPFRELKLAHKEVPATKINTLLDDATVIISFTQLKYHEEATMSGAIKNIALSWPPAEQHGHPKKQCGIHQELHGFITAMAENIPIDLSIVSASPAMIGTGPSKGLPRHTGIVIAGTDPVATDTVGARLLGFRPQAIRYLFDCGNKNIGTSDIEKIKILGMNLVEAEENFSKAAWGETVTVDKN